MAETTDVIPIEVDTSQAVKTIADLKAEIKDYKEQLNGLSVEDKEYAETVQNLTVAQNELRLAMNGSATSMQQLEADAKGLGTSYNSLVNQMAALKKQWRATTDETTRADLGKQILDINTKLKEMDASTGNFQRNVGDYTNSISNAFKDLAKDMPSFFGTAKKGVDDVSKSLALMGKQPIMGLVLLLAPIITKIAEALKENETAMEAIRKVGKALEPVMDALTQAVQWLAEKISDAADWFVNLLGNSSETFRSIIKGAVGVGNVILQALITPIKTAISAIKGFGTAIAEVFKGNFSGAKAAAVTAGQEIGEAFRNGYDVKANFAKGEEVAGQFIDGLGSAKSRKKASDAGKAAGQAYKDAFDEEVLEDGALDYYNAQEKASNQQSKDNEALFADLNEKVAIREEANQKIADAEAALTKALEAEQEKQKEDAKKKSEEMQKAWSTAVGAVASVLDSLADIYEANAGDDEKAEKKIKAIRIASATISMIQGAVGAYMQSVASIPPPAGIIAGVANAATVTAAGLANIAKMRATNVNGTSSTSSVKSPSFQGTATTAPVQPVATPTTLATLASDTQMLNQMGSQRVYILASDIEASNNARKVQVAETTF